MYTVQTWDENHKCSRYHDVTDAIDYDDAEGYIKHMYPYEKVIAIIKYLDDTEY